ncbi:hypothetical protein GIB67_029365 [Kingdonia uniflora]|uniref:Uncharacterized protein n=1 Tax=Kingdonia uniflora TaxID=39325 RepID=A0A7J7NST0_9MAGN|nr:hypothetical protein GIB67_029365 [Kingdonia uniflora]
MPSQSIWCNLHGWIQIIFYVMITYVSLYDYEVLPCDSLCKNSLIYYVSLFDFVSLILNDCEQILNFIAT